MPDLHRRGCASFAGAGWRRADGDWEVRGRRAGLDSLSLPHRYPERGAVAGCVRRPRDRQDLEQWDDTYDAENRPESSLIDVKRL